MKSLVSRNCESFVLEHSLAAKDRPKPDAVRRAVGIVCHFNMCIHVLELERMHSPS